ncbi:Cation-transporting ATPase [Fulvivirga imtechensis AK7]|uniref:P-type Cu(+) transporter n=1 Tax=Fulvivirga imtechensis AK7 TaxID=1237149 RepID=L8JZ61_9BACT|nr:HAD-IC family P-type ATPase [Fulvivirga imtechensis]ELR73468.1 Cation-transporting ATPase [Fulvivirga imtechensis AK7]
MEEKLWHTLPANEALKQLNSSVSGLSTDEAHIRQSAYGRNVLPAKHRLTLFEIILHQFLSPLIYVLLMAAVVSVVLEEYSDAGFILLVLVINAVIGTFQEWKAESKASALQEMIRLKTKVKRDGKVSLLDSEALVPGDIVMLESGDKVPADIRIVKENNLTAEEAILTGESMAVSKDAEAVVQGRAPVSEQMNMLFAGTTITTGRGTGLIVSTGSSTEIGKIASSLEQLSTGKAPLVKRMEIFTKRISLFILSACLILGVVAYYGGFPVREIFFFIVAMAVSAIPEGLPIAMTVALSIGASRMAKRSVIIRKLTAVEGLGSCTFIATDKTGTLTVDQQTARAILTEQGKNFRITGEGYNGDGVVMDNLNREVTCHKDEVLTRIARAIVICNEGWLEHENGNWNYGGDPIDVAMLALSFKLKTSPEKILKEVEKVMEVPFESERKYSLVYYKDQGKLRVAIKGAIEKLREGIDKKKYDQVMQEAMRYAEEGFRIIAVGGGEVDEIKPMDELPRFELLGFVALIDPLRPEARPAVEECHQAGVEVAMITGDHPATALAIAKEVGIAYGSDSLISGEEFQQVVDSGGELFSKVLENKRIYSRVSPHQKQIIVQALRESGQFIAVTGDGVNDAPALKTANIGVAMGYGTDVAKDTASIIISDNNFASIAAGIEEGRYTYSNLRKIIYLLVSTGAAEILMIGMSLAFQLPLPFLPVQLLWLNLVTNGIQDVALAFEAGEKIVMRQPPRKPTETIFNQLMIRQTLVSALVISLLTFGLWYHLLTHLNWDEPKARNIILLLMVLLQNFHALNCRSETTSIFKLPFRNNKVLIFGIIAAQTIHIIAMDVPFMQELLALAPVSWADWLKLFLTASIILATMEIFKVISFKVNKKQVNKKWYL